MQGLMQDWPLRVSSIIDHAAKYHANRPVIGRPAPAQQANVSAAVVAAPETKVESESDEANDADEEGLLGNIRIIPAEERVRRPGLKRK